MRNKPVTLIVTDNVRNFRSICREQGLQPRDVIYVNSLGSNRHVLRGLGTGPITIIKDFQHLEWELFKLLKIVTMMADVREIRLSDDPRYPWRDSMTVRFKDEDQCRQ